jgi:uncharacterized protein (DUF433 family)
MRCAYCTYEYCACMFCGGPVTPGLCRACDTEYMCPQCGMGQRGAISLSGWDLLQRPPREPTPTENQGGNMTENTAATRSITRTEGVCGGVACLEGTGIPVWIFAVHKQMLGFAALEIILKAHPHLTAKDVEAAWAYADANREDMEQDFASYQERDAGTQDRRPWVVSED